jgi:hypothetical protein
MRRRWSSSTWPPPASPTKWTDADEKIFAATRPILLNGIDLLDRSLLLTLPTIPEEQRRDEEELFREFEAVRPRVLGALLYAVSAALRNRPARRPAGQQAADGRLRKLGGRGGAGAALGVQ